MLLCRVFRYVSKMPQIEQTLPIVITTACSRNYQKDNLCSLHRNIHGHQTRQLHIQRTAYCKQKERKNAREHRLVTKGFFDQNKHNKQTFIDAVQMFEDNDENRRGHVEFIYAALKEMQEFGVLKDLETYKKLIDLFPKGKFIPSNMFQIEFQHYPKHQQCAIDVLDQMEENGVIPDLEVGEMLINTFGKWSHPMRKYLRMMYWMPKFKNLSPWPLPREMPNDSLELAKIAIKQIMSVDLQSEVEVYQSEELEDSIDPTWIVSGQAPQQHSLISDLPTDKAIFVEGAFRLWMRNICVNYFILRADAPHEIPVQEEDEDDVSNLKHWIFGEEPPKSIVKTKSVHEQSDGTILSVCATGTSSRDSLLSWIRFLEKSNPNLKDIPIVFTLKSPLGDVIPLEGVTESEENIRLLREK